MTRLFATDLDGTLLNALHEVDRTILSALGRVIDAGRHVALATGRLLRAPSDMGFGELPLELVCGNGAVIRDADGQLLRSVPLDRETLEELLRAFPDECLCCVTPETTLVRGSRERFVAGLGAPRGILGQVVRWRMGRHPGADQVFDQTTADVLAHEICKVNFRPLDQGIRREAQAFVSEHAGTIVNASFDGSLFELTAASVDKGEAVSWLAAHLGLSEDEVAVYGDGGNDLAMLRRFSHSFATANGSEAARSAAGTVIGRCLFHAVPRHMVATVRREGPLPGATA